MSVVTVIIAVLAGWTIAAVVLALLLGAIIGRADREHRAQLRRRRREQQPRSRQIGGRGRRPR
ncbi:hypothetical protein [Amnibacterium sp.]|uniref:hypothetical protein n=1 Tax=Amnibacterium sp. TaxID=1872496 RepID=UPI003F7C9E20